ncbi:MAG: acetyl-CoA acetyltransferase [Salinisphaera sp.]|nr:acetyl-CoA acetyltransferase [Salinisphaera sp.]
MASGIKDRVAIVGMGCTPFAEHWNRGTDDLLTEAFAEALADAGLEHGDIEAAWYGSAVEYVNVGNSAIPGATALRLSGIPVTRVENMCATGTEALRGAVYAVACGAADIALAIGAEKLKDSGYGGLPVSSKGTLNDLWMPYGSAPAGFAQLAAGYRAKYGFSKKELKTAIGRVSWKSHQNGVKNPKAHIRKAIDLETIINAPIIAEPLGLFDCCGVSDGAACAIVTTPDIARGLGKSDIVTVKALQLSVSAGKEWGTAEWDAARVKNTRIAAGKAYAEAGINRPRDELSTIEVHDCFSITELVTMEDLGISEDGGAVKDVMDGFFDADGGLPCQIDGGLKCFGHPIGASGLRMAYENYLQLLGRAAERQLAEPVLALSHNLGGVPYNGVAAIAILGRL